MLLPNKKTAMVFDFDGTITEEDVFDAIFSHYADPAWWKIHKKYHDREMTLKEAYTGMARYFRGSLPDLHDFLDSRARLRKGFRQLLKLLIKQGVEVIIASNGFDLYINYLLHLWEIDCSGIEVRCHHAEIRDHRFIPTFAEHPELKHRNCLIGKAEIIEGLQASGRQVCFFGNGYSDTPAAEVADLVFARAILADYCERKDIKYFYLNDFFEAIEILDSLAFRGGR